MPEPGDRDANRAHDFPAPLSGRTAWSGLRSQKAGVTSGTCRSSLCPTSLDHEAQRSFAPQPCNRRHGQRRRCSRQRAAGCFPHPDRHRDAGPDHCPRSATGTCRRAAQRLPRPRSQLGKWASFLAQRRVELATERVGQASPSGAGLGGRTLGCGHQQLDRRALGLCPDDASAARCARPGSEVARRDREPTSTPTAHRTAWSAARSGSSLDQWALVLPERPARLGARILGGPSAGSARLD